MKAYIQNMVFVVTPTLQKKCEIRFWSFVSYQILEKGIKVSKKFFNTIQLLSYSDYCDKYYWCQMVLKLNSWINLSVNWQSVCFFKSSTVVCTNKIRTLDLSMNKLFIFICYNTYFQSFCEFQLFIVVIILWLLLGDNVWMMLLLV